MRALLWAALRRFVVLFFGVAGLTALVSLLLGLLFNSSISRAISLGFYGVGSFLLITASRAIPASTSSDL